MKASVSLEEKKMKMKFFGSALAVSAAVIPAVSASQFVNLYGASETNSLGFIIELEPGSSFGKRDVHSEFHLQARSLADYSVRHEFKNPKYFYGLSIEAADVSALASLPEVKNMWPNRLHDRPRPVSNFRGHFLPFVASCLHCLKLLKRGGHVQEQRAPEHLPHLASNIYKGKLLTPNIAVWCPYSHFCGR